MTNMPPQIIDRQGLLNKHRSPLRFAEYNRSLGGIVDYIINRLGNVRDNVNKLASGQSTETSLILFLNVSQSALHELAAKQHRLPVVIWRSVCCVWQ